MRVLFLGTYNESEILTGPDKVAKRIFDEYAKTEQSSFLEYFQDGKKYGILKKIFGKEIIRKDKNSQIIRVGIIPFVFFLFSYKPRIIHIITFERFAPICFRFKKLLNYKVIFNLHGIVHYENTELSEINSALIAKNQRAEKQFIEKSDILLYLSDFYLQFTKPLYMLRPEKLHKIKNGVDTVFAPEAGHINRNNSTLKIVFCGDIKRKDKGFSFLKDALKNIQTNIDLYIVGSKTYEEKINGNIKIHFAGFLDAAELNKFYEDKDVFISASFYDTFSIATAEAMCSGVIPIATNTTGMSQYIEEGVNGFKVEYGDTNKLKEIIAKLSADKELRNKISVECENMYGSLKWSEIIKSYRSIYQNLIN